MDGDSDGSVGSSEMKLRFLVDFFYFLASLRGQCALVQQDLLDYNEPLLWNVIGTFDSSFIFLPSSDVGISPSLVRQ